MSGEQSLRELVNARLTAAAEEIFTLFERTIAGYKAELIRSKEENQRKQQLLDSILSPTIKLVRVDTHFPPGPDESEEHHIKQEEELPFTVVCIKREESPSPLQQRQTEHQEQTQREDFSSEGDVKCENSSDDDEDWVNPLSCSEYSEFEDNEDHYLQNQVRKIKFVPETCVFENSGVMSDTDGRAECYNPQSVKICNYNEGDKSTEHEQVVCKKNDSNSLPQMENQTQERPLSCSVCTKIFNTVCDLNEHKKIHHKEKPFSCSICMKTYTTKQNLLVHKRIHTKEKPYKCLTCGKVFSVKCNLKEHTRIHTGEKPLSCTMCEQTFRWRSRLHSHMRRMHTGEKPFSCTFCNKAFSQKCDLDRHKRLHTGEKPFSCGVCEKSFRWSSHLHKHMAIHSGEKPYKCAVCNKTFSQNNDLKRHAVLHTGEKPFNCTVCDKAFSRKSSLERHTRKHIGYTSENTHGGQ